MKHYSNKTFKISRHLEASCWTEDTRYGFRHLAVLYNDNGEIADAKCCYYNRTWERYEYQSVLEKLLDRVNYGVTPRQLKYAKRFVENYKEGRDPLFNTISLVAKMGAILAPDQKSKNDFQTRILKAGLENRGLIMPDDWNELSEDDKENRLTKVIAQLDGEEVK